MNWIENHEQIDEKGFDWRDGQSVDWFIWTTTAAREHTVFCFHLCILYLYLLFHVLILLLECKHFSSDNGSNDRIDLTIASICLGIPSFNIATVTDATGNAIAIAIAKMELNFPANGRSHIEKANPFVRYIQMKTGFGNARIAIYSLSRR